MTRTIVLSLVTIITSPVTIVISHVTNITSPITIVISHVANITSFVTIIADQDRVSEYEMKLMDIDSEHVGIPVSLSPMHPMG